MSLFCWRYAIPLVSVEPYTSRGQNPNTLSVSFARTSLTAPPLVKIHGSGTGTFSTTSTVLFRKAGVAIMIYDSSDKAANSSGNSILVLLNGTPNANGNEIPNKNPYM